MKYFLLIFFLNLHYTYSKCPIVNTVENLNLTEYISRPWYIQKQQTTLYLSIKDNYCVRAIYNKSTKKVPFYSGIVLNVNNYANENKINGYDLNKNNSILCARIYNSTIQSKLLVAPCFLPNSFAGDYWVISVGPESNNYEWAIVSGGQPMNEYKDGCTTNINSVNNAGFWFFTRQQVPSISIIKKLESISKKKGFTLSQLHEVEQSGCQYK